jgi:hypothetical protein
VIHLSAEERAAFVNAVQPVLEKHRGEINPQLYAALTDA